MGVGNKTRLPTTAAMFFFSKLYADVSENNMLSREFELAWGELCSKV